MLSSAIEGSLGNKDNRKKEVGIKKIKPCNRIFENFIYIYGVKSFGMKSNKNT